MPLKAAIDALVVEPDDAWCAAYSRGRERLNRARSPDELRLLASHLDDPRPSPILEAVQLPDGRPYQYTVGDCIHLHLRCLFVDCGLPKGARGHHVHLDSVPALRAWLTAHDYDLTRLRRDHASGARPQGS